MERPFDFVGFDGPSGGLIGLVDSDAIRMIAVNENGLTLESTVPIDLEAAETLRTATGDLDGDGDMDLVVGVLSAGAAGRVLAIELELGRPVDDSSWWELENTDGAEQFGWSLAVADLDRNGTADIVVGDNGLGDGVWHGGTVSVFLSCLDTDGDGAPDAAECGDDEPPASEPPASCDCSQNSSPSVALLVLLLLPATRRPPLEGQQTN